ncbi:YDG domain-containing protein [Janthinobacterium sp. JC611]|uniref:YDG domain-containing protein n=1 Tax=Janthinobacterium sp. JC611 TaxID=2816201 RepID=UPI001BFD9F0A|nr:YDG domain-containing protein [Janthinobacterium sp. JC611]
MNRIYRSIWNQATGAYAAVSENVKSAGKRSMPGCSGGGAHFALTTMAAALMLGYGSLALAGPAGGTVVAGQASIHGAPGATVIRQGSQNAVINWSSFNIGKGESVQFQQPDSNAVALNRVLGSDGTSILGNLSANGKVFIVNPNGVLFGQGASVNTAGLVASTLDISNADFMAGKYQFSGNGAGKVLNQGSINAPGGYVALLGANVSNEGTIQARLGSVALAAGRAITLDVAGDGLLNVAVDQGAVGALVHNGGMIKADGGSVVLTAQAAGDLLKTVVNNTGVIEAHSIDTRGGTIKLLGDMQSGTVHAAGTLDASAPDGGNGGFIDTSAAHVKIDDALKVTTAAPRGLSGTWLIDPTDFNIAVSGGDMTGAFLSNSLKSGNVQIQSISGSGGTQGNINVNDNVNWAANKLTLTAQNNININKAMRGAGTASLALEYGQSALAAGNQSTYNVKAEVDLPSGNNFSTKLGSNGSVTVYQVINSLGAFNSTTGNDVQGMQGNLSGNYVLGSNIDARGTSGWDGGKGFAPIGSDATPFTGTLDGLGHEIVGLTINRPDVPVGMFGNIGAAAAVRNLSLSGVSVAGSAATYSSTYAGIGALAAVNNGKIDNVYSSGAVSGSGYVNLGGLVGINAGTISNSRVSGTVVSAGDPGPGGYGAAGGFVGLNAAGGLIKSSSSSATTSSTRYVAAGLVVNNSGTISDSYATGTVNAGANYGGGLVSFNNATITNSYATGAMNASGSAGGLVGINNDAGAIISNSYATGKVTSTGGYVGGLVGLLRGTLNNSYATGDVQTTGLAGGIVGYNVGGVITNVYTTGKVTGGGASVGAIVGEHNGGSVNRAYFDSTINSTLNGIGQSFNGATSNAQGLSTAQMLVSSNYVGFNFTTTAGATGNNWVIVSGDGSINGAVAGTRPMLASEWSNTINSTHQLQLMAMNKAASYTLGSSFSAASTAANGNDVWGTTGFIPVGTSASAFTGSLDGTGHIISSLNIAKTGVSDVGLFGAIGSGGAVANVGLSGGSVTGGSNVGALAGSNAGTISGSFATSDVTSTSTGGGLVGSNTGTVVDSYASGAVNGTSAVGGLVGSNGGSIANSYANGSVSGSSNVGGLVGTGAGSVTGSYWDTAASGQAASAGGTGMTTAQLKNLSNYTGAGWELAQMWVVYDGQSGPFLRSFMTPIAVRVSYDSKVYDGVAYAGGSNSVSYSNTVAGASLLGTPVYAGNASGAVNAGTYGVSASGLYASGGQAGYAISYIDGGLVITPKALTVTGATAADKIYDGNTTAVITGGALSGLVNGETLVLNGASGVFNNQNAGNGKAVTITGGSLGDGTGLASNYTVGSSSAGTASITPKALTVTGATAADKTYDGNATAVITGGALSGLVGSETLVLNGASGVFNNQNAGNGKAVTVTGGSLGDGTGLASNYTVGSSSAGTASITPKALTLTGLGGNNKVYDGTADANLTGGTLSGLVNAETLGFTVQGASYSDKNAGTGKAITIGGVTLSDGSGLAGNYTLSAPGGLTGDIAKATITGITGLSALDKVYNGNFSASLSASLAVINGKIAGDDVQLSSANGMFTDKNVGTNKAVNISNITLSGSDLVNYDFLNNTASATASITPKAVTLSGVTAGNKVYDGTAAAVLSGGVLSGMVAGETLNFIGGVGTFSDKNAGTGKVVTISGTTLQNGTGLASNYTFTSPGNVTADISKASISGVSNVGVNNKTYDGQKTATLNGTATFAGIFGDDSLTVAGSGEFSDKNAGTGKTVNVSGLTLGGADAGNYTLAGTTSSGVADIAKASIGSVSNVGVNNKTYDGSATATLNGAATFNGMLNGDSLTVAGSGAFSDKNAGTGKTVNVSGITLGGADAGNYTLASATSSGVADITPKALTVTGQVAGNKVYDGNTVAQLTGGSLSGLVGDETLAFGGQTAAFADKNAGNAKAVTVSGTTLLDGSGSASNYTVSNPTGLTASITPASISAIAGIVAANKVYDGGTAASLNLAGASFNGIVAGDTLSLAAGPVLGTFSDKNAAIGKTVTISGLGLAGADAGNYLLASNQASTKADITPAALTVSASGVNKVYDATTNAVVSLRDNRIGNDQLTIASNGASFSDKNAGVGKTVTVAGIRLSGADAGNYVVNGSASTTATISQAALTVKVDNAEKDQGRANPDFRASYSGLLGGDTLAAEVNGNLAFSTPATTASAAGNYLVSASGQASNNYALNYVDGVLKVKPTEALQSAVANVIAAVAVAPSQGNMVQADMIANGETAPGKPAAQDAPGEAEKGGAASAPVVQLAGNVVGNVLPGLRLSVVDSGLRLPVEVAVGTRQDSQ